MKFVENLPGKIEFFLPGSTKPQISKQIDAAGIFVHNITTIIAEMRLMSTLLMRDNKNII